MCKYIIRNCTSRKFLFRLRFRVILRREMVWVRGVIVGREVRAMAHGTHRVSQVAANQADAKAHKVG